MRLGQRSRILVLILAASLPVVAIGFLPMFACIHASSWEYGFHRGSYWQALLSAMSHDIGWGEYLDMTWPDHRFMLGTALISAAITLGCFLLLRRRLGRTRERPASRGP